MQPLTAFLLRHATRSRLRTAIVAAGLSVLVLPVYADSASDLHAQLKERWYTTEIVVFRYTNPASTELLSFEGERVTAAEYRKRALDDEPEDDDAEVEAISVLTLGDTPEDVAEIQRPALDVEPGEDIQDYGSSEDLGSLVARNMATWENQLRQADGEPIDPEQLTLTEQVAKLTANRGIELLTHTGWTQAVPERDSGTPLPISGGETFVDPRNGDSRTRLEGEVTVTLGRYLHVQPTLFYTPEYNPEFPALAVDMADLPVTANTNTARSDATVAAQNGTPEVRDLSSVSALDRLRDRAAAALDPEVANERRATDFEQELPPYLRLEQSRRVRSGELHYIDHPAIGVLVRVTPAAAPTLLQEQFTLLQ